jgi:hypothetical protein
MKVLRVVLCAFAAICSGELLLAVVRFARDLSPARATGLTVVFGQFLESFFSPIFWLLAILLFSLFLAASRIKSKSLRMLFFWTPTVGASLVGIAMVTLFAFLWVHFRAG